MRIPLLSCAISQLIAALIVLAAGQPRGIEAHLAAEVLQAATIPALLWLAASAAAVLGIAYLSRGSAANVQRPAGSGSAVRLPARWGLMLAAGAAGGAVWVLSPLASLPWVLLLADAGGGRTAGGALLLWLPILGLGLCTAVVIAAFVLMRRRRIRRVVGSESAHAA